MVKIPQEAMIPAGENPKQFIFDHAMQQGFDMDAARYVDMVFDDPKGAGILSDFMAEYRNTGTIIIDGVNNPSSKKKKKNTSSAASKAQSSSALGGGTIAIDYEKLTECIQKALATTIITVDLENSRAVFRSQRLSY